MTISQLWLIIGFYGVLFALVARWTRAKVRRILGATVGGAIFGVVGLLAIALGEAQGWWTMPKVDSWYFQILLWLAIAISCAPFYLVIWRVVRRFGGKGFTICVLISTISGPPRDYWVAATFPAWMTFAHGIAPVLADAAIYALLVFVGYGVMFLIAGPAREDSLARES